MTTTETRNASYFSLENLGDKQRRVFDAIAEHGPVSDRAISEIMRVPINQVTGRRFELWNAGYIEEAGHKYDHATNRSVMTWKLRRGPQGELAL